MSKMATTRWKSDENAIYSFGSLSKTILKTCLSNKKEYYKMTLTFDLKGHCELWPKYIKNPSLGTSRPRRWNSMVPTPYLWG